MNTYGNIFKITIFGESHGTGVGIVIDNCVAGMPLQASDFEQDMVRRKGGILKGTTPRQEDDIPIFLSGIFNDVTTGAPLTIMFANNNTRSSDYEQQRAIPRPGHADFVAQHKYGGYQDYRGGGHFSGRLTACLVAAGVVAKKILQLQHHITIHSSLISVGGNTNIDAGIQEAIEAKDSVGGIVDCTIHNVPIGIGEPFFASIESNIAQLAFSIPAIKGIEFGSGFAAAAMYGSNHNDVLINDSGTTATNHAGGIVGGISNGNHIYFKLAVKPTSSTPKVQHSYNTVTQTTEDFSTKGRHDLCIAIRVPVVAEAIAAIAVHDLICIAGLSPRVVQV